MFLKVVAFTRDVGNNLETVRQAHFGDLTKSRVRFLRRGRVNTCTNATLLRATLKMHRLVTRRFGLPRLADQLLDRRHWVRTPYLT
mgnify:CR=1 FL=1